jgi:hypothetical protein
MRMAIYNLGIPENLKSVTYAFCRASRLSFVFLLALLAPSSAAVAADWSASEQQLAKKIVAVTGLGAASLTVENRSSLGRRDSDIVQNGMRSALEQMGFHLLKSGQAATSVTVTLSENETSYVWVAQIQQAAADPAVVMVSLPRSGGSGAAYESMPIMLRKIPLWTQEGRILDVAILEDSGTPSRIAVLSGEDVSTYRFQNGRWQTEQMLAINHPKPWPLDSRGRLVQGPDRTLTAFLPGVVCRITATSAPSNITCQAGDDPWPIVPPGTIVTPSAFASAGSDTTATAAIPMLVGFFAPTRNYFTGVLSPAIGKFNTVPKFYTAAFIPREEYTLWMFASADGAVQFTDGINEQTSSLTWGSDIATVRTTCGAGWQVLATNAGDPVQDSVRAYEFPDRDPVAVSAAVDFPGPVTAVWTETRGDTAIAIARNRDTGSYEAFRLSLSCGQ